MTSSLKQALGEAQEAINEVQRRPAALRRTAELQAKSGLQAALLVEKAGWGSHAPLFLEIPRLAEAFRRAPGQALAQADLLAGGPGVPVAGRSEIGAVLDLAAEHPDNVLMPMAVHAAILHHEFFGQRSVAVALAVARAGAMSTGFDPRGLCVPEGYYTRDITSYKALVSAPLGESEQWEKSCIEQVHAWKMGAGIALDLLSMS
ncbi:MAG: hypothetical protein Q3972_06725 [Corynebacterium sp.]|nr:hypothetical protein [Corynebacterium sp.]